MPCKGDLVLRICLDSYGNGRVDINHNDELFQVLQDTYGMVWGNDQPANSMRCLSYAIGLKEHVGSDFVEWLISGKHLEDVTDAHYRQHPNTTLALYFDGPTWKHAGIVRARGRIESKFGGGSVFLHGPYQVPISYGDTIKYYNRPDDPEGLLHQFKSRNS